jgi:ketosteroid isomerase-like protein
MSANLDLVRSIYADWGRGDCFSSADWVDPCIEFVWADEPDPGSWTGPHQMAKAWSDQLTLWSQLHKARHTTRLRVLDSTATSRPC